MKKVNTIDGGCDLSFLDSFICTKNMYHTHCKLMKKMKVTNSNSVAYKLKFIDKTLKKKQQFNFKEFERNFLI